MSVIGKYLSRQQIASKNIEAPAKGLKMVVVIPCFMEPDITTTLLSIWANEDIPCKVEVIVVVNSSEISTSDQVEFNRVTFRQLQAFARSNNKQDLKLTPILIEGARRKHAGVGLARKTGMDMALKRLVQVNEPNGIIVSLDADSKVSSNYLNEIHHFYQKYPAAVGANLAFKHVKDSSINCDDVYHATQKYELYLRYFRQALKYTGFPYAYHTIGSCFTLSAEAYARVGGMPRKQAGEDFYLLHKVFPMGYFGEITNAKVFPSARESDRVPFGTGPMVSRILQDEHYLPCYSFDLFVNLKVFLSNWDKLYENLQFDLSAMGLDVRLADFLEAQNFKQDLSRVRLNSASKESFIKQLFASFNAFKIIQYLNGVEKSDDVTNESIALLRALGYDPVKTDVASLLELYRNLDEGKHIADS